MSGAKKYGLLLAAALVVWAVGHGGSSGNSSGAEDPADRNIAAAPAGGTDVPTPTPSDVTSPTPTPTPTKPSPEPRKTASSKPARGTALAALATLAVKGRAPMTGYERDRFGQAWLDADRNGCDTRNDILRRDLTAKVFKSGTGGCVVLSGRLADPYTGGVVPFVRGGGDDVDIDHVVALANAWVTGAFRWDIRKRAALANDPLQLLAVDMHANRQKGAGDAATWLPSNRSFRCAYVARQIAVKKKYALWVTSPERDAMRQVLRRCPGQLLPQDRWHAPTRVDQNITDPGAPATTSSQPRGLVGGSVYYKNCDAVRAAGAAPIHRGDPGYAPHLDRDGDGVGCE